MNSSRYSDQDTEQVRLAEYPIQLTHPTSVTPYRPGCETHRSRDGSRDGSPTSPLASAMQSPVPQITHARALLAAAVSLLAVLGAALLAGQATGAPKTPNVVLILMDDETTSDMSVMRNVQSMIADQGVSFSRAYASFPLCCPSRATLLSGQYMHNHGVRGNLPPNGGWQSFVAHESNALPVWLHDAGFYNVHIGKYLNGYGAPDSGAAPDADGALPVPPGWDQWYGKVSEDALYYDYQLIEKTRPGAIPAITFYGDQPDDYQTDVLSNLATNFVNHLDTGTQTPFFLNLWFNSPHFPFDPAPRDRFRLAGTPLAKLPGFNEKDISDKPKWFQREFRKRLGKRQIRQINGDRRRKSEQLLSADEDIGRLIGALRDQGVLDNTYIIFTSDQGFFRGEHRIQSGKYLPYDPSARVPLLISGPGIPHGQMSNELVWFGDITQAILQIASGSENPALDGRSLLPYAENPSVHSTRPILLEADTGSGAEQASAHASAARARAARVGIAGRRGIKGLDEEPDAEKSAQNANHAPAYRSVRTDRYEYTVYANGQTELYDMIRDPAQLHSLAHNPRYRYVRRWLLDRLSALSSCAGASCRVELGPDPQPLPKSAPRKNGKGKRPPGT